MVLMKVLDRFRNRSASKDVSTEPDNGANSFKKMKKMRSVRVGSKRNGNLQPAPKATDEPPNYMKTTTSYDKRKEKKDQVTTIDSSTSTTTKTKSKTISTAARALVKNSSLKFAMASMKKNTGKGPQSKPGSRAASSSITDSTAPNPLEQGKCDSHSSTKVCPYSYCSLHGHNHGALPSLKRFLSLKVQKSMKSRGYSTIEKKGGKEIELVDDVVNDLFIEIHTKLQTHTLQQGWGEHRSEEEIQIKDVINMMDLTKLKDETDSVTSFEDCGDKNSELSMEEIQVINQFLEYIESEFQEKTLMETELCEKSKTESASHKIQSELQNDGQRSQNTAFVNVSEKQHRDSENHFKDQYVHSQQFSTNSTYDMDKDSFNIKVKDPAPLISEQPVVELRSLSKVKRSRMRRQSSKNRESIKVFKNSWPPRLLERQAEPQLEQVNLKHQTVEERRAGEEWMIDYALRKALRRLTSVRTKKVPELVAAFETVLPQKV